MNESQPKRPPRMTRTHSKESSTGLLMSVIRSLTASRDADERDREKAHLERQFQESDARLDQLILNHHVDLTNVIQAYSKMSDKLNLSQERLKSTKEKLILCKEMLRCKKDELRKLWIESIENKHILDLLNEIENVTKVPSQVSHFISKKHYLHATKLITESIGNQSMQTNVEALKEVKIELNKTRDQLFSLLIEDLHKHIYVRPTTNILKKLKRTASERKHISDNANYRKVSVADILSPTGLPVLGLTKRRSPNNVMSSGSEENLIEEDLNAPDPETDSKHFISIIIECLSLLNKVPEAVEIIKDRIEKELFNIVKRTGRELSASNQLDLNPCNTIGNFNDQAQLRSSLILDNPNHKAHLLQELCDLLFQQIRVVASVHENVVLSNFYRIETKMDDSNPVVLYNCADIWTKVQTVLQLVCDIYLDTFGGNTVEKNITNNNIQENKINSASTSISDLNTYFVRKRPVLSVTVGSSFNKIKKTPLFKFDSSSHAISLNAYLQEQKESLKEKSEKNGISAMDSLDIPLSETEQYVCEPAPENIVILFNPMMKFISEIDDELGLEENNHCTLYAYIIGCVKFFLKQIKNDLEYRILDTANKSLDSWKIISDTDLLSQRNQNRPILESTVTIEKSIQDLRNLMFALPIHADDFLTFICNILSNYKETCLSAYRGIVHSDSERVISDAWAKDEDINRFLKDLPNWPSLQKTNSTAQRSLASMGHSMTFDESPEDIRMRNKRESEILTSNLTQDTLIPNNEIISDVNQLKTLAQLQESMEWLGSQIQVVSNNLPKSSDGLTPFVNKNTPRQWVEIAPLSDVSIASLNQLSHDFEELAETCLLVLHLEIRVHCFYYLLRVTTQGNFFTGLDTQEPDIEVVQLNKDISSIDEALSLTLQPWKLKYIFEGVGHLVSTILINSATTIKRINQNGVKKMCRNIFATQQNLTSVTMSREVALDYARQYFELFYLSPEEILASIEERGPQFQAQEYLNAINLLHRSNPGRSQSKLQSDIRRLNDILNEAPISV